MSSCLWLIDVDDGSWDTSCGEKHCFFDGGPKENSHTFCPYCGRAISICTPKQMGAVE